MYQRSITGLMYLCHEYYITIEMVMILRTCSS